MTDRTTFVVGYDGSEPDRALVRTVAPLAAALDARLVIVHALDMAGGDEAVTSGPAAIPHAVMAARIAERKRAAEADLAVVRAEAAETLPSELVTASLYDGRPFEALTSTAAALRDACIVVGARRGRSILAHTVDRVLRRAAQPVLVVPEGATISTRGPVLASLDGGEVDVRVWATATDLARRLRRPLSLVHVRAPSDHEAMQRITAHLHAVAPEGIGDATLSVVGVDGSIAKSIGAHATRLAAALVVVGNHGRRGLERWVLGSTAESLAHACTTPFVVTRAS